MDPPNTGDLMITLRAGRLTPEESVEVASRTRRDPERKPPSMMSLSSKVRPEVEKKTANLNTVPLRALRYPSLVIHEFSA